MGIIVLVIAVAVLGYGLLNHLKGKRILAAPFKKTGDLARLDAEGFCYIIDRAKDMLIRGGENIYCVEVENALYEHPAVMDAAVIGIPHRILGEEPAAAVHLKDGCTATEEELRHFVAQQLAAFKVPVKILFLPETLPRNPNGKIMKKDLKGLFEGVPAR